MNDEIKDKYLAQSTPTSCGIVRIIISLKKCTVSTLPKSVTLTRLHFKQFHKRGRNVINDTWALLIITHASRVGVKKKRKEKSILQLSILIARHSPWTNVLCLTRVLLLSVQLFQTQSFHSPHGALTGSTLPWAWPVGRLMVLFKRGWPTTDRTVPFCDFYLLLWA